MTKPFKRIWLVILVCAFALSGFSVFSQTKEKPATGATLASIPKINYKEEKLKNGLRVFLIEDHSAPVVSLALIYDVGSRNERKGRTGFAHLFEHMMFQGSENVGKSEHFITIETNGGDMNGTTNEERTLYYETLPSNQLDLMLFLESDRMKGLDISNANLDNQRNAVQEERRLSVDNQPYGKLEEQFDEKMYDNFAYKHSVIGSMEDLDAASVEDVKDFFRIYYAPNNATLALVGDFKSDQALARVKNYFEAIPSQPAPPQVDISEPEQKSERRFTVEDGLAQLPMIDIGYKGYVGNSTDVYALQVLANVLGSGNSSRLYQKLVKEKQLAVSAFSYSSVRRGPGAFLISATVASNKKVEEVEPAIYEEIAKLQKEPIEDWELDKAKQFARRTAVSSRQSSLGLAVNISESAVAWNDPNYANTRLERIMAVSKEDVQRVAQKYLQPAKRTVGIAIPKAEEAQK
jgi:zinc protease